MWIDDPIGTKDSKDLESVQRLKNILSTGPTYIEVKFGSMVFDSRLVIISTNIHPQLMAESMGPDNETAMYRRFTDTCGAHYIGTRDHARGKLAKQLCEVKGCS